MKYEYLDNDEERHPEGCWECGGPIFTDNPICEECDAASDCGMVQESGVYRCLADGSEQCCFVCPYHEMIGLRVEVFQGEAP